MSTRRRENLNPGRGRTRGGGDGGNEGGAGEGGSGDAAEELEVAVQQLEKLHRQHRMRERNRRQYRDEATGILMRQRTILSKLEAEQRELRAQLSACEHEHSRRRERSAAEQLTSTIRRHREYTEDIDAVKNEIANHRSIISEAERRLREDARGQPSLLNMQEERKAAEEANVALHSRIQQATVRFNAVLAENSVLRTEIEGLLKERDKFLLQASRLEKQVALTAKKKNEVMDEVTKAYTERDDAGVKIRAVRERATRDSRSHGQELKKLQRVLDHQTQLKSFVTTISSGEDGVDDGDKDGAEDLGRPEESLQFYRDRAEAFLKAVQSVKTAYTDVDYEEGIADDDLSVDVYVEEEMSGTSGTFLDEDDRNKNAEKRHRSGESGVDGKEAEETIEDGGKEKKIAEEERDAGGRRRGQGRKEREKVECKKEEEVGSLVPRDGPAGDLADNLLTNFLQNENDNYTVFSYVSGVNNEVSALSTQISRLKQELEERQLQRNIDQQVALQTITQLQDRSEAGERAIDEVTTEARRAEEGIATLKTATLELFTLLQCDVRLVHAITGGGEITSGTLPVYLSVLEQKVAEVVQRLKGERRDGSGRLLTEESPMTGENRSSAGLSPSPGKVLHLLHRPSPPQGAIGGEEDSGSPLGHAVLMEALHRHIGPAPV